MILSIIAVVSDNLAIGKDNDLLWHLPKDLAFFKAKTIKHHIVMGRKSYFSIPEKYRPLPDRTNIVITRDTSLQIEGVVVKHSLEKAIQLAQNNNEKELFIIGGGEIFRQALPLCSRLYVTEVHTTCSYADVFFPRIDTSLWKKTECIQHFADEKHLFNFDFVTYEKIS